MRRRRIWLLVGASLLLALAGVGYHYQYVAFHRPIRVGMSEQEVDDVMGISWGFPWSYYLKETSPDGVCCGDYELTDIFGNRRGAVVYFVGGRVYSVTVWDRPFSQRPPWVEWLWPKTVP